MIAALYPTKRALRDAVGKPFRYRETSLLGAEFKPEIRITVVGPSEYDRRWYANVWTDAQGIIRKVK